MEFEEFKSQLEDLVHVSKGTTVLPGMLSEVANATEIDGTRTDMHCYHLSLDGNHRAKSQQLAEALRSYVLDYAIPRGDREAALEDANAGAGTQKLVRLYEQAKSLFTDLDTSGEGGELLLYLFAERLLGLPQIVCKMDLKTSARMHFHGSDGIHAGVTDTGKLALYWGESKLHASVNSAVTSCFKSLKEQMHSTSTNNGVAARDFQLIFRKIDLGSKHEQLEQAIVDYFDEENPNYFSFEVRAVALVGFDLDKYGSEPPENRLQEIEESLKAAIPNWKTALQSSIATNKLDSFQMHVFAVPFPSVQDFRDNLLTALGKA